MAEADGAGGGAVLRYFAAAADAAGVEQEPLLPVSTVGELRAELAARYGEPMARVLRVGSFLVDGVATRDDGHPLGAGVRLVDVLPPFTGG